MKIPLEEVRSLAHLDILTYPTRDIRRARSFLSRLAGHGVTHLEFSGPNEISGVKILGKGTTSIVLKVYMRSKTAAVKILRIDANRESVKPEVEKMSIANEIGVGPNFFSYDDDMIIMELVEGNAIPRALEEAISKPHQVAQRVLSCLARSVFDQCSALDLINLDHGQLSKPDRHIYITKSGDVKIIDFESASTNRRPQNLTSVAQYLLVSGPKAKEIRELLSISLKDGFDLFRAYKRRTGTYEALLEGLHI